jgi:2-dehydro-3-deoxygalactonokinase
VSFVVNEVLMIAVDWGTSSFRAYRLAPDGAVTERRAAPLGILNVEGGRFAEALESQVGDWLEADAGPIVMSGMIGSRQGWKEAAYVECPAGGRQIAANLQRVIWGTGRTAWIAPGVCSRDAGGVPDVMRGEETQILGVLDQLPAAAMLCLPGTHSKWVEVSDGHIQSFTTHMTGELFAVLRAHSILGRMMTEAPTDLGWFDAGVRRAEEAGGLLHHLFGVRARGLFGELPDAAAASHLSGILIGHELLALETGQAPESAAPVYLLGAHALEAAYRRALEHFGRRAVSLDADAAVRGLWRLAQHLSESKA